MTEHDPSAPPPDDAPRRLVDRVVDLATRAFGLTAPVTARAQEWAERQEAHSRTGVALGWLGRYRRADGQLFALLLAAYLFVTLLPAMIAVGSYADRNPEVVSHRLIVRLHLTGRTATLTNEVLQGAGGHQLTATLVAVGSIIVFGLGIGRTLQLIYGRIWDMPAARGVLDNARYLLWLLVFLAGALLYVVQEALVHPGSGWIEWVLAPLWIAAIVGLLAWTPVFLLHGRVTIADAMPGALVSTLGLIALRLLSSIKLTDSLNWYSKYYGGIGIVMAIFFWLILGTTMLIMTSALAPAYAVRRAERAATAAEPGATPPRREPPRKRSST